MKHIYIKAIDTAAYIFPQAAKSFFQKNGEFGSQIAVTLIKIVSCVSQAPLGQSWDSDGTDFISETILQRNEYYEQRPFPAADYRGIQIQPIHK